MRKKPRKSKRSSPRPVRRFLLWTAVFLLLIAAADQMVLRFQSSQPPMGDLQDCYRDFRCRLLGRFCPKQPRTIEAAIKQEAEPPAASPATAYLYVDGQGVLQFADRMQDVPLAYRKEAQPLAE